MKMSSSFEYPSVSGSRTFAAPSESLEVHGQSEGTPSTPMHTSCPKLECASSEHWSRFEKNMYDEYWISRWSQHPLNRNNDGDFSTWHGNFDWERLVLMKDVVWEYLKHHQELPRRAAPNRWPKISHNNIIRDRPYFSWYKKATEDPDEVLTQHVVGTNSNGFYAFTRANYEAAFHLTKHIWKPRCVLSKMRKNWQRVIHPICYKFLTDVHDEITGLGSKKSRIVKGMMTEFDELYTTVETTENTMEWDDTYPCNFIAYDGETGVVVLPPDLHTCEDEVKIGGRTFKTFIPIDKKYTGCGRRYTTKDMRYEPYRWYPEVRVPRKRKEPVSKDIHSNFLDRLPELYLEMGRPDLTWRIMCSHQPLWLQKRVYRTVYSDLMGWHRRIPQWDADIVYDDMNDYYDMQYIPEGKEDECPKPRDFTEKYSRWLVAYTALFQRHKDKMYILSHRGRFGYLTKWDLSLFDRQKRSITNISPSLLDRYKKDWPHKVKGEIKVPDSYVEEADFMLDLLNKLSREPNNIPLVSVTMRTLEIIWCRWNNNDFEEWRTKPVCWEEQKNTVWEAQSSEVPLDKEYDEEPINAYPYWLHIGRPVVHEAQVGETPLGSAPSLPSADATNKPTDDKPVTGGDKKVTLTMADDRPTEKAKETPVKKPNVQDTLRKEYYDLLSMVERPMLIDHITWSTSDEMGKYLWSKVVPNVYFSATEVPKTACQNLNASYVLSMFGSVRFDMVVKIQMNSVKFQQGQLKVIFEYFCDGSRTEICFNDILAFPNVSLDATDSNSVELKIPFTNFRDAFPIYNDPNEEYTYFGRVHVVVWNPLQTGASGSTDASLSMWMWLENLECFQLCNAKDPGKVTFAPKIMDNIIHSTRGPGLRSSTTVSRTFMEPSTKIWEPQMMESVLDAGVGVVSDIGANLVEHLLAKFARGSNSKPNMSLPPQPIVPMAASNSSFGDGPDLSNRISLSSLCVRGPDPWNLKMNTLRDLYKVKSRVRVAKVSVDDMENDVVMTMPVTPMMNAVTEDYKANTIVQMNVLKRLNESCPDTEVIQKRLSTIKREGTVLDYLSNYYLFWCGGFIYVFEVVKTGMIACRLMIRYEPYASLDSASLECQKLATPGVIWDLHEKSVLKLKTPYMSTQPFLCTQYKSVGNIHNKDSYSTCNGLIQVTVVNRLKVTTGVAKEIQINIYQYAAEDFEFACHAPLDGIMKIGKFHADLSSGMYYNADIPGKLFKFLQYPIEQGWYGVKNVTIGGDYYAYGVLDIDVTEELYVGGPMIKRVKSDSFKADYYKNIKTIMDEMAAKQLVKGHLPPLVPKFDNFGDAYKYTSGLVMDWNPSGYGVNMNILERQRMAAWLTLAVMGQHSWGIESLPRAECRAEVHPTKHLFGFKLLTPAKEYVAQGKESETTPAVAPEEKEYIDPFTGFVPPKRKVKNVFGEDFSDMYKSMKRWAMWKTIEPYFDMSGSNQADEHFLKVFHERTINDCARMMSAEIKNYCIETRIPVTPFLPYHGVCDPYHTVIPPKETRYNPIGSLNPYKYQYGGGLDAGSQANLLPSRFFGELFTFWKGSMRYRFTFPRMGSTQEDNWCVITYHPRMFTSATWGFANTQMVHQKRLRDMTKMGSVLYIGNVQANIDVEVPSYSKYSHMYLSERPDDTSQAGTIVIYTPLLYTGAFTCPPDDVDLSKQNMFGVPIWVWVAVGDDFEMSLIRPPPPVYLWPPFWNRTVSSTDEAYGYDRWTSFNFSKDKDMPSVYGEVRKDVGHLLSVENPIKSATETLGMWAQWNRQTASKPDQKVTEEITRFSWNSGFAAEPKFAENSESVEYVAQMMEDDKSSDSGSDNVSITTEVAADDIDGAIHSAMSVIKTLPVLMKDFKEVATTATSVMEDVRSTVKVAGEAIVAASAGTTKVTESIEETSSSVSKVATYAFNATRVGLFFKGVLDALKAEEWSDRWMPIAMCAMSLGLSPEVVTSAGEWLFSSMSEIFGPKKVHEDHKPQSWEDTWDNSWEVFIEENITVFRMIAAGAITILTFYMTSSAPANAKGVTGFATSMINKLRNFAIVGAALKTLDWMFKWVGQVILSAAMTIADWISGGMVTAHRMSAHYPDVISWLQSIEKYNSDTWRMQLAWNSEARMELWKQMDLGDDLLSKLGSKTGHLYTTIMRGILSLQKAHDAAIMTRSVSPFRIDPFHICLYGNPGVGKSAILAFLMNFVSDQLQLPRAHRFYPRGDVDKFWSNYMGQSVVVIDDLFQDRKASAIKELITMKSNMAMPLNMADTDEKGRYFISKLIGTTTNTPFPKPDDITNYHALWRRRNLLVQVRKIVTVGSNPKADWSDLVFDIVNPNPRDGESAQVIKAGLSLMEFLVYAADTAELYLEAQRKLMFTGLKGRVAHVKREDEEERSAGVVTSTFEAIKMLITSKAKVDSEFLRKWIQDLSPEDYRELSRDAQMMRALREYEVFRVWDTEQQKIKEVFDFFRGAHNMTEEQVVEHLNYHAESDYVLKETGDELNKYWICLNGEKIESAGYIQEVTVSGRGVNRRWFPQVLDIDDLLAEVPDRVRDAEVKAQARRTAAQRDIQHRVKMSLGFDGVSSEYMKKSNEYTEVILKDKAEIKNYVQLAYPHLKPERQEEMMREFEKVFEWAHDSKRELLNGVASDQVDKNISTLFDEKYASYWKKEKDNWMMTFPETMTDAEYELSALWDLCTVKWSQAEINGYKGVQTEISTVPPWVKNAKKFYSNQVEKTTNWFKEHPKLTVALKFAAAVAALFGAYKIASWACPAIIDKIKAALATIFGWGISKMGPERVERVGKFSRAIMEKTKGKLSEYYEWVREWMRMSDDATIVEMSEDDEKVVLFAEQLEKLVPSTKTIMTLKGQIPQKTTPSPEGKRVMNAYMLGQDRTRKPEGTEKTLSQRQKEPLSYQPHGSQDQTASDVRNNKIINNICRVSWTDGRVVKCMSGIFIQGRTLMVPKHFFHGIEEGTIFAIRMEKNVEYYDGFQSERCVGLEGVDACLYQCGPRVGQFKKLTQHFISENELKFSQTTATLNLLTETLVVVVQLVTARLVKDIKYDLHGTEYVNNVAWSYEATTSAGDCGAILMADNTSVRSKLLGMHVCGVRGQNAGCSCIITKEVLVDALTRLPDQDLSPLVWDPQDLCDYDEDRMSIRPRGNFRLYGAVKASKAVKLPHKTEISPSAIHDLVREHVTEPAVLDKNDPRLEEKVSPLLEAVSKYGVQTKPFPPDDVKAVTEELACEVLTWEGTIGKRLLTDHEAVWGNEHVDFLDRMNMGASPGYPYTLSRPSGEKGKDYLYDYNSEDGIACAHYRNEYKTRERLAQEGIRKQSVWTDCLKDERRPIAKIKCGKTRSFTLPPADFVQLCRKYFGAFNVAFYQNCLKSFSAVGIDPYSYQWTQLWQTLRSNSNLGFGGDFKNFDGIGDPDLICAFFDIVERWYKKNNPNYRLEDAVVRKVLVDEMIKTWIICKNSLYEKPQGNSSGNPETVIINTFLHMFLLMLTWIGLARKFMASMISLYFFRRNVRALIYGDDGVYSVKFETSKWFNLINMGEYLAGYGITYTDELKTGLSYGVRPIRECTFLKNGFKKLEGTRYMLAPISIDTIYELTNWVRKTDDPIAQLRENLEDVFTFAFHHGEEFFDSLLKGVNEALSMRFLREIHQSYALQKEMFLAKCLA